MSQEEQTMASASSPTRSLIFGGYAAPASLNTIDFVTIATTGNASDFGDISVARYSLLQQFRVKLVQLQWWSAPAKVNIIEHVTIATRGNATDFGDLTETVYATQCVSNSIRGVRMGGAESAGDNTIDFVNISTF